MGHGCFPGIITEIFRNGWLPWNCWDKMSPVGICVTRLPRLHLAPARGLDPRGESDSPFFSNVDANHQPHEAGLTRLFCPSKKVGFDPRAGSDTAIFCSVNRKPSLPRQLIANFRRRSRASYELRFSTHTAHTLRIMYREMLSISYVQGVRHIHTQAVYRLHSNNLSTHTYM